MKIYNETKTQELNQDELDFEKGYLKADKIVGQHHEATAEIAGKTAEEIYNEELAKGAKVEAINRFYRLLDGEKKYVKTADGDDVQTEFVGYYYIKAVNETTGGREVERIKDIAAVPAKEAYDEYEDIQVYVPYTEEELEEHKKAKLRSKRKSILTAFDTYKNNVEYGIESETEEQHTVIIAWYKQLLDLDESAFDNIPERVQYYMAV